LVYFSRHYLISSFTPDRKHNGRSLGGGMDHVTKHSWLRSERLRKSRRKYQKNKRLEYL